MNHNLIFDTGENPLENIKIRIIQTSTSIKTDKRGFAFFTNLSTSDPVDLAVDLLSIEDIQKSPIEKGYRVWPKIGGPTYVDIPIGTFGDIDGTVYVKKLADLIPKKRIKIILYDNANKLVRDTYSDYEGYYVFEKVKPGKYRLEVDKLSGLQSKSINVEIDKNGEYSSDNNFIFKPR